MLLPENICLAINISDMKAAISDVLSGKTNSLADTLVVLGRVAKIKIWFKEPVTVRIIPRWRQVSVDDEGMKTLTRNHSRTDTCHVFSGFFLHGDQLCYKTKKNGRTGQYFEWLDLIERYELVLKDNDPQFKDYEEFKRKFDSLFITEDEIQKLWNGHSSQHGGKYTKQDFHKIGPRGRKVLKRFLERFPGVSNAPTDAYDTSYISDDYKVLKEHYTSFHHSGRDISISHQTNCNYVFYSSEYSGCGNGRYGLVANKNEFLWLEDD